jgi:hypothetical protein
VANNLEKSGRYRKTFQEVNLKPEYSLQEFWADLRSVNQARRSWGLIPSFDEQVKNHFESTYGVSQYTTWRYGRYMLVLIYINTNKKAFDFGKWVVAGEDNSLISDKLAGRVLKYAVEHPITMVHQFPPPSYFLAETE